jgi:hypothetical protein
LTSQGVREVKIIKLTILNLQSTQISNTSQPILKNNDDTDKEYSENMYCLSGYHVVQYK